MTKRRRRRAVPDVVRLTKLEIEALWAASGNIDPCMFDEMPAREGPKLLSAWRRALDKLAVAHEAMQTPEKTPEHGGDDR